MSGIRHMKIADIEIEHRQGKAPYEYDRRVFVKRGVAKQCQVAVYELAPGKTAFPYHYHVKNEEVYYILSGVGRLQTPEGERDVAAGELLFFPADATGSHKLTNISESEKLVYIDFDTTNDLEVAVYPDSGKIGVWGYDLNQLYRMSDQVEYYNGE